MHDGQAGTTSGDTNRAGQLLQWHFASPSGGEGGSRSPWRATRPRASRDPTGDDEKSLQVARPLGGQSCSRVLPTWAERNSRISGLASTVAWQTSLANERMVSTGNSCRTCRLASSVRPSYGAKLT